MKRFLIVNFIFLSNLVYVNSSAVCPDNTTYLPEGNHCVFKLEGYRNFTDSKDACYAFNAKLLMPKTGKSIKEVCAYSKTHISKHSGFVFLDANPKPSKPKSGRYFWNDPDSVELEFSEDYWMDHPSHMYLPCVELTWNSDDYCQLNDIVCWKKSWVVCAYPNADLCKINKGDCEQLCIARGYQSRTCKCKNGIKVNETKCVTPIEHPKAFCTIKQDILSKFNRFCYIANYDKIGQTDHEKTCNDSSRSIISRAFLPNFTNGCDDIKDVIPRKDHGKSFEYHTGLEFDYNDDNKLIIYSYGNKLDLKVDENCLATSRKSNTSVTIHQCVSVVVGESTCCVNLGPCTYPRLSMCESAAELGPCGKDNGKCSHICYPTSKTKRLCGCRPGYEISNTDPTKCVEVNECEQDKDECAHNCTNTVGSRQCFCRPGFVINSTYDTECEDIDECQTNNGSCHQMCLNLQGSYKCECRKGFVMKAGKCEPDDDKGDKNDNTIFMTVSIIVVVLVLLIIITVGLLNRKCAKRTLLIKARRTQKSKMTLASTSSNIMLSRNTQTSKHTLHSTTGIVVVKKGSRNTVLKNSPAITAPLTNANVSPAQPDIVRRASAMSSGNKSYLTEGTPVDAPSYSASRAGSSKSESLRENSNGSKENGRFEQDTYLANIEKVRSSLKGLNNKEKR